MAKYELILFDADGTLFDYERAEAGAIESALRRFGLDYSESWLARYREINDLLWRELEEGKTTSAELRVERFRRLLSGPPCSSGESLGPGEGDAGAMDLEELSRTYLTLLSKGSHLMDGALDICRLLAARCRLAILTNGIREVQMPRFEASSLKPYIERVIISEDTGFNKPHRGIFEYALKAMGHSDKATVMMVGDSLNSDIRGGIDFGITACWFNPKGIPCDSEISPDYEIRRLSELEAILSNSQGPFRPNRPVGIGE
ncbi:MAG: YjjG family noncanonical pyrimidine nucleotidase [Clostridia bacterium]|nr:YjjG family noncanonical pyrimidine nucleotidase [Clostridia bacterium]